MISRDHTFSGRIAVGILAFEGDSQVVCFNGNYLKIQRRQ